VDLKPQNSTVIAFGETLDVQVFNKFDFFPTIVHIYISINV